MCSYQVIIVLSSIFPPTRDRFRVMDIPDSRPDEIRSFIGVLPESNGFPHTMTGIQFLVYMGRLYGQSKAEAGRKAAGLLDLFDLEEASTAPVCTMRGHWSRHPWWPI